MKRIFSLMAALFVCASNCFAWSAESFIGNDYDHYPSDQDEQLYYSVSFEQPAVMMLPRSYDVSLAAESVETTQVYELDLTAPDSIKNNLKESGGLRWGLYADYDFYLPTTGTSYPLLGLAGELTSGQPCYSSYNESFDYFGYDDTTVSFNANQFNDSSVGNTFQGYPFWQSCGISVSYSIPVPADTYGVSFTPDLSIFGRSSFNEVGTDRYSAYGELFINGTSFLTFDNEGYHNPAYQKESVFTFSQPIQSIELVLYTTGGQYTAGLASFSKLSGSALWYSRLWIRDSSTVKFGFLSSDDALGAYNDQAQDDLNDHSEIESEWTGSMTKNFNALKFSSYSYPTGLVSAFAFISGIFNDIWNAFDNAVIIFTLPLYLGLALLVVGKLSRNTSRSRGGSSRSGKSGGG